MILHFFFKFSLCFCYVQNREKPTIQFATMKFHKKCVYSQTHFLYTRDESLLPDMPPPHPPYTRKSEIFDARQYRRVDKKALKVSRLHLHITYIHIKLSVLNVKHLLMHIFLVRTLFQIEDFPYLI